MRNSLQIYIKSGVRTGFWEISLPRNPGLSLLAGIEFDR